MRKPCRALKEEWYRKKYYDPLEEAATELVKSITGLSQVDLNLLDS